MKSANVASGRAPAYNSIVARAACVWAICGTLAVAPAQTSVGLKDRKAPPPQAQGKEEEPPEEDPGLKPKTYEFNPLQAKEDMRVGIFYFHKGSFKAAANRFRDAGRWDPSLSEAFLRLAEAEEKLKDKRAAKEAYSKYLELAPDSKDAAAIKKRIAGL